MFPWDNLSFCYIIYVVLITIEILGNFSNKILWYFAWYNIYYGLNIVIQFLWIGEDNRRIVKRKC